LAAHFAKRNTKFGGGGKRGRAKIPSPQPPFLFARPSVQFGARSAPSVPFKKGSDFVKQMHLRQDFGGQAHKKEWQWPLLFL